MQVTIRTVEHGIRTTAWRPLAIQQRHRPEASWHRRHSTRLDASTWTYSGHVRVVYRMQSGSWTRVFFFFLILRVEHTSLPRPFFARVNRSILIRGTQHNTTATTASVRTGKLSMAFSCAGDCGTLLKNLVELPVFEGVDEATSTCCAISMRRRSSGNVFC